MITRDGEKGAALIITIIFASMLAAFVAAALREGVEKAREAELSMQVAQGLLLAESAVDVALADLGAGNSGIIGAEDNAVTFAGGSYWTEVTAMADDQYKKVIVYSRMDSGPAEGMVTQVEIVVKGTPSTTVVHPAFSGQYGIYVGNTDDDPTYQLTFGGQNGNASGYYCNECGAGPLNRGQRNNHEHQDFSYVSNPNHADLIVGDLYVNGDAHGTGNSGVQGNLDATGSVTGTLNNPYDPDDEGFTVTTGDDVTPIPAPDFASMNYEQECDVNVTAALDSDQTIQVTDYSGLEDDDIVAEGITTLPADDPAHIFCKESFRHDADDPDNAYTMDGEFYDTTATNYHLGDWANSSDGEDIQVDDAGNHKSYYIDGNLHIDTLDFGPTVNYVGTEADDGVQITIVVRGNIYVGDNISYSSDNDCIALIAIKSDEERVEGSGNVFFGDLSASRGALNVDAMLFAEDAFADVVRDSGGSPISFTVNGLMAASGQVNLQDRGRNLQHSPMTINHDARLANGSIELPALPLVASEEEGGDIGPPWSIVVWRKVR